MNSLCRLTMTMHLIRVAGHLESDSQRPRHLDPRRRRTLRHGGLPKNPLHSDWKEQGAHERNFQIHEGNTGRGAPQPETRKHIPQPQSTTSAATRRAGQNVERSIARKEYHHHHETSSAYNWNVRHSDRELSLGHRQKMNRKDCWFFGCMVTGT